MFATRSGSSSSKTLWKIRDAKGRCDAYHDQTSEQKIVNPDAVWQGIAEQTPAEPSADFG